MIVADRGMGKTLYAKNLVNEIPADFYILDKDALVYKKVGEARNPRIIIVDDLHYLLQAMRLGHLENHRTRDEEDVLDLLKNYMKKAEEDNAKVVFISDEGPGGLCDNFLDLENRKKFLELFEGCVSTGDDSTAFYRELKKTCSKAGNVYNFRDMITDEMAVRIRKYFGMRDVPLVAPPGILPPLTEQDVEELKQSVYNFVVHSDMPEKIAQVVRDPVFKQRENMAEFRVWSPSNNQYEEHYRGSHRHKFNGQKLVAPIRVLKVLYDEFGAVDKESLRIPFGADIGQYCYYNLSDISKMARRIESTYSIISERDMVSLARLFLVEKDENKLRAAFLKKELSKE